MKKANIRNKITTMLVAVGLAVTLASCQSGNTSANTTDNTKPKTPTVSETLTGDFTGDSTTAYVTDETVTVAPPTTEPTEPVTTATEPKVTEPAEPVTTATEPKVTEPAEPVTTATEPVVTDPVVTDPVTTTTEPVVTDPVVTDPITTTTEPVVTDPVVTDPVTTTTEPVITEPVDPPQQTPEEIRAEFASRFTEIANYIRMSPYTFEGCNYNLAIEQLEELETDIILSNVYNASDMEEILDKILSREKYCMESLISRGTNKLAKNKYVKLSRTTEYLPEMNINTIYFNMFYNIQNSTSCNYSSNNSYNVTLSDGISKQVANNSFSIQQHEQTIKVSLGFSTASTLLSKEYPRIIDDIQSDGSGNYLIISGNSQELYSFDSTGKLTQKVFTEPDHIITREYSNITLEQYNEEFNAVNTVIETFEQNQGTNGNS